MNLYAVCLNTADASSLDDWWIEFYWADDADHAEEQAEQQPRPVAIVCVAQIPAAYVIDKTASAS